MKPLREPPVKLVRFLCVLIGLGVFMPIGYRALHGPGTVVGLLIGGTTGWALGGWVKRNFLEF